MKHYPSISARVNPGLEVYAFDKLDGSNFRVEWSKKRGFYKFGSRQQLIAPDDPMLGKGIVIAQTKFSDDISRVLVDAGHTSAVCFFEFAGPKSFAGVHDIDDDHGLTLFDVATDKRGIIGPERFVRMFGHLNVPRIVASGQVTPDIEDVIRTQVMPGITFEGVVCKEKADFTSSKTMFKVKTHAWLAKLKEKCGGDEALMRRLA